MKVWLCILLFILAGCASTWERHQDRLTDYEQAGKWKEATSEARWLVDNGFRHAPEGERSAADEADRYLQLADLAIRAGSYKQAVDALREALQIEPETNQRVMKMLQRMPLPPEEFERLQSEFAWNTTVLAGDDTALLQQQRRDSHCFSYRVREIRIRHERTMQAAGGRERELTYDARPWVFDQRRGGWRPDGEWMDDAGTEIEVVGGPEQPRYRAVLAADHGFVADGTVPPCHQSAWSGPYESNGTVFVTAHLPGATAPRE